MTSRPRKKITATLTARIFARDGHRCVYCRRKASDAVQLTLDHVVPHSEGGADNAANLVTCCLWCNTRRGVNDFDLFAEWLRRRDLGDADIESRVLEALSKPLPPAKKG